MYRVDTCTDTSVNYDKLCYEWLSTVAPTYESTLNVYDEVLVECPCNLPQAENDPQYYQETGTYCFYTQYAPFIAAGARVSKIYSSKNKVILLKSHLGGKFSQ